MSFSKEQQDYHLTPRGWEEGSFQGDLLGGKKHVEIPEDRVLTISCYDEKPSAFSEPYFYDNISWKSDNEKKIDALTDKYGDKPDWFGYEQMK